MSRRLLLPILAGAIALLVIVAGGLAWRFWPVSGTPERHVGLAHELSREPRRDVMAPRHDLHGEGTAGERVAEIVEPIRPRQPGLVGEDVKARVVKPPHHRHLPIVSAREDDDVTRPVRDEPLERAIARPDDRLPGRGVFRAAVERVDEGEEIVELRSRRRVDEDLLAHVRMRRAQSQRGVEVAGLEEGEGVHDRRPGFQPYVAGAPVCSNRRLIVERR